MAAPASAPRLSLDPGWPRLGPHPAPSLAWCLVQPLHRTPCVVWHTPHHTSHTPHTAHHTTQHSMQATVCVGLEGEGGVSTPSPYQGQPSLAGPSPALPSPAPHYCQTVTPILCTHRHQPAHDQRRWCYLAIPIIYGFKPLGPR